MLKLALTAVMMAAVSLPAMAEDVPATIIAMERAALDRSDKGDVQGFLAISASGVVYQDPALDAPLEGLAALTAYYAKFPAFEPAHGVMSNTKVQVLGNVAVLSFHYVVRRQETVIREWNCTEVYRKTRDAWRIVNTHWSLTNPLPQKFL
jgi:hypothetical protein